MEWLDEDHPEWHRRLLAAQDTVLPWISRAKPLAGATVLEYGSGLGAVSCALAPFVERHIGYDIEASSVAYAREKLSRRGIENSELYAEQPERILEAVLERHRGELDVLMLYAVLEHMTVQERIDLLELAPALLRPGGVIAVVELPNRLVTGDHHTSQIPYFSQLPDELALRYWQRSPRPDFLEAMEAATANGADAAREALTRWGRGASFHEFELVFSDLSRHVVASGYDPLLLPERPIRAEDLSLARELEALRPDIAPSFSRYWIDVIISPEPVDPEAVSLMWPWALEVPMAPGVAWTRGDSLELLEHHPLQVKLPCQTTRIVIGAEASVETTVSVRGAGFDHRRTVGIDGPGPHYFELTLPVATAEFEVVFGQPERRPRPWTRSRPADGARHVTFLGYEASAARALG